MNSVSVLHLWWWWGFSSPAFRRIQMLYFPGEKAQREPSVCAAFLPGFFLHLEVAMYATDTKIGKAKIYLLFYPKDIFSYHNQVVHGNPLTLQGQLNLFVILYCSSGLPFISGITISIQRIRVVVSRWLLSIRCSEKKPGALPTAAATRYMSVCLLPHAEALLNY